MRKKFIALVAITTLCLSCLAPAGCDNQNRVIDGSTISGSVSEVVDNLYSLAEENGHIEAQGVTVTGYICNIGTNNPIISISSDPYSENDRALCYISCTFPDLSSLKGLEYGDEISVEGNISFEKSEWDQAREKEVGIRTALMQNSKIVD